MGTNTTRWANRARARGAKGNALCRVRSAMMPTTELGQVAPVNLGTQTQGEGGRADLSCWLLDTNGGALSGTGLDIPATLTNREMRDSLY